MNIMGIKTVIVYQKRNEIKYRRCNDAINGVSQIMRGSDYAGFQIDSFGTVNVGGYIGSIMLYSYNAEHYDAVVVNHDGIDKLGMFQSVDNPVSELSVFRNDVTTKEDKIDTSMDAIIAQILEESDHDS